MSSKPIQKYRSGANSAVDSALAGEASNAFCSRVLALFETIHPLDRVGRAGYILRGVAEPESVSAHSHFVALLTLLFCDEFPGELDSTKALAMALIHDLPESKLMDIPMPACDAHLGAAKEEAEQAIMEELLDGFATKYGAWHRELLDAQSPEAKLVRGLDKAQMMIKVWMYEREGRGRTAEFWQNPRNFQDYGYAPVSRLFDTICEAAGKTRPRA
jgi:putative hydrolase of HD superfamily